MPGGPRYEDDFYAWTQFQAEVLRAIPVSDNRFDRDHLVEEIEDLGKSERNAVRSEIRRILEHLLKLAYSPAAYPRADWMVSIANARAELEDHLTASLRRDAEASLPVLYERARDAAAIALRAHGEQEAEATLPTRCPFTFDEVLQRGWYPEPHRPLEDGGA
jgi:hypothetical protein